MKNVMLAGACALLAAGCATVNHVPLPADKAAQFPGKTVATTQYPAPDFTAFTPGSATFGLIGAFAAIAEGNQIVKTNAVEDPALKIGQGVTQRLAASWKMKPSPPAGQPLAKDDPESVAAAHPGVDYLVDVKTLNWMFIYYPTDWAHYQVSYSARLRLIESSTRKVVAETMCRSDQGDEKNRPTKDQLLDQQAALLKEYLSRASAACVDAFSKEVLKL